MADDIKMDVLGLDLAAKRMKALPGRVKRSVATGALRVGANMIRDNARARARLFDDPWTSKSIARQVVSQTMSRKRLRNYPGADAGVSVGVRGGARQSSNQNSVFYWRFLEFGTQFAPAQPFMRPAGAEAGQSVVTAVAAEMSRRLDGLEG